MKNSTFTHRKSQKEKWFFRFSPFDFWSHASPRNDLILWIDVFFHEKFNGLIDFNWWLHLTSKFLDFHEKSKNRIFHHVMKCNKAASVGFHGCLWCIVFDYFCVWSLPDIILMDFSKNDPQMDAKVSRVAIDAVHPQKNWEHHRVEHWKSSGSKFDFVSKRWFGPEIEGSKGASAT